jgi:transcription elongation factor Elf1
MGSEFACPRCESPSVAYPDQGEEGGVVCAGCGAFLATRSQFRRIIERWEMRSEVQTSGC